MLPSQKEMMFDTLASIFRWVIGIGCAIQGWVWLSNGLDMIVR